MSETTAPCVHTRRANHYGEALAALRGLLAAWTGDREDPAYRAARHLERTACRSCGEPAVRNHCCAACWRAYIADSGPLRPVA